MWGRGTAHVLGLGLEKIGSTLDSVVYYRTYVVCVEGNRLPGDDVNNATNSTTLTIGKVAKRAGIGVETIRFYEREKLLPEPARDPSSGYRRYPESTISRLQFIARAKELGFTLRETRELLELRAGPATCGTVRARAEDKIDDVRRKIEDLQRIERALLTLAEACPGDGALDDCPILGALEGGFGDGG